jgi:SAM-dependent methyltransferase
MLSETLYSTENFQCYYESSTWRDYRHWLADLIKYADPGPILDVGAGLGFFTECAIMYGLDCVGIEGNDWACQQAQSRGLPVSNCLFESNWPFANNSFATVMCNQVVEHIPDNIVRRLLQESHRVLRSGGTLMIYSPSCFNRVERKNPTHINLFTPSRLRSEVVSAGFEVIDEPNYLERANLPWRVLYRFVTGVDRNLSERFLASANCIARKLDKA